MIKILVANAQQALDLKQQVLDHGLTQGQDFSWRYNPDHYDGYNDSSHTHPTVEFEFQEPSMETFFQLRWK